MRGLDRHCGAGSKFCRFDREIGLGVPDQAARAQILEVMTRKMKLQGDFDYQMIAKKTAGYVGADLASLTKEAAVLAINRIFKMINDKHGKVNVPCSAPQVRMVYLEEAVREKKDGVDYMYLIGGWQGDDQAMELSGDGGEASVSVTSSGGGMDSRQPVPEEVLAQLSVTMEDFLAAVKKVQPSSKREGFAAIPDVTWGDVGALADVREELAMSIIEPITYPERFEMLGLAVPAGVLLFGPPGTWRSTHLRLHRLPSSLDTLHGLNHLCCVQVVAKHSWRRPSLTKVAPTLLASKVS